MVEHHPSVNEFLEFFRLGRKIVPRLNIERNPYFKELKIGDEALGWLDNEPSHLGLKAKINKAIVEALKAHKVYRYFSGNYYFKNALENYQTSCRHDDRLKEAWGDEAYQESSMFWLMCIMAVSAADYFYCKENKTTKLTQKEKQKRLKTIFNVKKMAEDGELPLTSDESKQWIELIEKMHGRFEPLSWLSSDIFKELETRPKPKLQQEKTLVYNLCNLYHYEYKKVDQNVIENLAQVILLSASDETIKEWVKDIILDPPFRTREEWDEDAREFEMEEAEEEFEADK